MRDGLPTFSGSGSSLAVTDAGANNSLPVTDGGIAPATRWFAITPANTNLSNVPASLNVSASGNLVVRGFDGVDATFAVLAGQILPIRPTQVRAGTPATVIGLLN